jgi:hypothetical protein
VRDLLNSFFVPSKVKNLNLLWERERERAEKWRKKTEKVKESK